MRGKSVGDALALAADYTVESIRATLDAGKTNWYCVVFETAIPYVVDRLS